MCVILIKPDILREERRKFRTKTPKADIFREFGWNKDRFFICRDFRRFFAELFFPMLGLGPQNSCRGFFDICYSGSEDEIRKSCMPMERTNLDYWEK